MITLYIKTHNKTGLKYFGKTQQEDVHKYQGSGKYWKRHINKHGYDVTTEIYAQFDEECEKLVETALRFSEDNDIVESKKWANLQNENGLYGNTSGFFNINSFKALRYWEYKTTKELEEINKKKSHTGDKNGMYGVHRYGDEAPNYGNKCTKEKSNKISNSVKEWHKNNIHPLKGKPTKTGICNMCGIEMDIRNLAKYHNENCKPKEPKVSKRNYNKLKKLYTKDLEMKIKRKKFPEYPKSGKISLGLQVLFEEYDIPPYNKSDM